MRPARTNLILALSSGFLLGCSFPPSPFYSLAYVAFIPFFVLLERIRSNVDLARYSFVFLFIFHCSTVYWAGGFTHMKDPWMMTAGLALLVIHPFLYFPSIFLSSFVRKSLGRIPGLVSFALFWISYEYIHSVGEFTFPWMTVGNSQAYDTARIQIAEYTSTYGLSFLIFTFNILAYFILIHVSSDYKKLRSRNVIISVTALIILYVAPLIYGRVIIARNTENRGRVVRVAVLQPNIDPWEKWGEGFQSKWTSYVRQLDTCLAETRVLAAGSPDLIVWPETAIPFQILLPRYAMQFEKVLRTVDSVGIPVFTGLAHAEFVDSAHSSVTAQRYESSKIYVEHYNSATLIEPGRRVGEVYKKMVLVPFAERIPYAATVKFLIEPLKWSVGISSWGMGKDTIVYDLRLREGASVRFSGMICYESVYPDFVRQFVKRGAEFLVVITNDSWWGKTSGAYQHAAFAALRAVENRRWVVQCANGGISEFVDPVGRVHSSSELFTEAGWVGAVQARDEMTFYSIHGDLFAQSCLFCSLVIVILALYQLVRLYLSRKNARP